MRGVTRVDCSTIWLLAVLLAGCWEPRYADVTHWSKSGRVDRLVEVVADRRAVPEVRAQAAAALFELSEDLAVESTLTELPPDERSPVVAYLLDSFLPDLLARDRERGHAAIVITRPFGRPDSVERSDRLLLHTLSEDLQRTPVGSQKYASVQARLQSLGRDRPRLLLPLLDEPTAPLDTILRLVSAHPDLLAAARQRLVRRIERQGPADEALLRALARWGPTEPLTAQVSAGGPSALAAARALAFAAPDPDLAGLALEVAEQASAPPPLRTAMLTVLERMGPSDARTRLLRLIRMDPLPLIRLHAFRALAALEGAPAVLPALESFPRQFQPSRAEVITYLVPGLRAAGADGARQLARGALRSRSRLAQLTGILALEELGEPQDAALLAGLARQPGPLAGEASRVAQVLGGGESNSSVAHR